MRRFPDANSRSATQEIHLLNLNLYSTGSNHQKKSYCRPVQFTPAHKI